ncbi:hypothetical protein DB30_06586 [Enhygromyxa salina]|uniref:Uncharacterized protein n=1 Tax=Enhygromyxa salina TaxID=215803 RepID=A0A0C2DBZ1_9BACT|nr:DUF1566 domain-containing protein [Enhygromyxa salina]KIG18975.1 hypothetical protein DB30_06586 [Enhygromyxa salina]
MRPLLVRVFSVSVMSLAFVPGCDKQAAKDPQAAPDQKSDAKPDPDADPGADDKEANFATPTAEPPAAPEGTITLRDPWLYVQTCAEPHPCPELMQPAGDAHCRELQLGGHVNWRLPGKDEVLRFKGVEGLEATAGYHWTRTPYEDDMGQAWIVDPEDPQGAPATTIPRDRKPFRIRCVKEP